MTTAILFVLATFSTTADAARGREVDPTTRLPVFDGGVMTRNRAQAIAQAAGHVYASWDQCRDEAGVVFDHCIDLVVDAGSGGDQIYRLWDTSCPGWRVDPTRQGCYGGYPVEYRVLVDEVAEAWYGMEYVTGEAQYQVPTRFGFRRFGGARYTAWKQDIVGGWEEGHVLQLFDPSWNLVASDDFVAEAYESEGDCGGQTAEALCAADAQGFENRLRLLGALDGLLCVGAAEGQHLGSWEIVLEGTVFGQAAELTNGTPDLDAVCGGLRDVRDAVVKTLVDGRRNSCRMNPEERFPECFGVDPSTVVPPSDSNLVDDFLSYQDASAPAACTDEFRHERQEWEENGVHYDCAADVWRSCEPVGVSCECSDWGLAGELVCTVSLP